MEFRSTPAISCVAREWRTSRHSLILPGYILWHFHKLALTWLRCFYAATCLILVYHRSHWLAKIAKNSIKLNDQSQKATKGQVVEIEPRTHHEKSQSQATRRNDRKYPSQKPPCSKQMPPEEGAAYNVPWDPIQGNNPTRRRPEWYLKLRSYESKFWGSRMKFFGILRVGLLGFFWGRLEM